MRLLRRRKIDALIGFPPDPQELRQKKIGRVIVNSGLDRPWSQYFCCIVARNREFVRKTRRDQACTAGDPQGDGFLRRRAGAGRTPGRRQRISVTSMRSRRSRRSATRNGATTIAEDTVRFYSLRLHEAGMIKSIPNKIIAQGTDWRFFNELKRELKALSQADGVRQRDADER